MSESVVGCVTNGVFYFKDAAHFHYALKKTELLEDFREYNYVFNEEVDEIFEAGIQGSDGNTIPLGYGSSYGTEYGGLSLIDKTGISLKLAEQDEGDIPSTDGTTFITFNADFKVFEPEEDITLFSGDDITISFTHKDNTPNCFGLDYDPEIEYSVELSLQSIYDSSGAFVTNEPLEFYSLETYRDSNPVSLAGIQVAQAAQNPIPLSLENGGILDYLRAGDDMWIEFPVSFAEVKTTADLPAPGVAEYGRAYRITSRSDANYNKLFIRQSDDTYDLFDGVPRRYTSKIKVSLEEVPGQPGDIVQGNTIYVKPVNDFDNAAWWSDNQGLAQQLFETYDGIYPGCRIFTNKIIHTVDNIVGDVLTLRNPHYDDSININVKETADLYLNNFNTNSQPKAKLLYMYGKEYRADSKVFLHQMTRSYKFISEPARDDTPVIITDMLSSEIDNPETTNIEFKIEGDELIFGRAENLIVNPSFLKEGNTSLFQGWETTDVEVVNDLTGAETFIHGRSAKLTANTSVIRQFIPAIDPTANYVLSFFVQSLDAEIDLKIYEFNNNGTFYESSPALGTATNTINFDSMTVTENFHKVSARALIDDNFNKSAEPSFTPTAGGTFVTLQPDTTDIIIEISKIGGNDPVIIDAVQLENAYNPTQFSHFYDYAIVEFESSPKDYAPRFMLSGVDNVDNQGFMVMDIDKVDLLDSGRAIDMISKTARDELASKYRIKPWAKMLGVNKFRHVGVFSKTRTPHKGEYFLLPQVKEAAHVNFLGSPYSVNQNELYLKSKQDAFHLVVEDESLANLPNKRVEVSWGKSFGEYLETDTYYTTDGGNSIFNVPAIKAESVSKAFTIGVTGTEDIRIGHPMVIGGIGPVNISHEVTVTGITPSIGMHCYMFNETGEYSPLMEITSTTGSTIDEVTFVESVSGPVWVADFTHIGFPDSSGSQPAGFYQLPRLDYEADTVNNGSLMLTFLDSLTYQDKPVHMYKYEIFTKKSATQGVTLVDEYSYFQMDSSEFNPIANSIEVIDVNNPEVRYKQSFTEELKNNSFYVNYATRTISMADPGITDIQVKWKPHLGYVSNAAADTPYVHYYVFMDMIRQMHKAISTSELQNQHDKTYFPALEGTKEALTSLNQDIYVTPHIDVQLYLNAQHGSLSSDTKITYRHNRPLI